MDDSELQPIKNLITQAEQAMIGRSSDGNSASEANGFLFTGNLQQSVPEALIFSSALQAVDVRVWMAVRAMIVNPRTPGCLPKRGELAESISVSAPTVSAALANLRCLRWLTLCKEVRNDKGRFVGNVYLFHDAPFSLADTLEIDAGYIQALEQNRQKSRTHLRRMSAAILLEIDQLYDEDEIQGETRLGLISKVIKNQSHAPSGLGGFGSPVDNLAEIDQKLTQRKNLSPVPVDNLAEIDQNLTQSKNLSLDDFMRSSSSSSSSSSSKYNITDNNTTTRNQRAGNEGGSLKQNPSVINPPDKNTYTALLSCPDSIDDIVQSLLSVSLFSNRDLQGITRLMRYYPGINHVELIDQMLGRMLAHVRGHVPDKIRNPTAFFKKLAAKHKRGAFNLDTFGQAVNEARRSNKKPEIPWSLDKIKEFESD